MAMIANRLKIPGSDQIAFAGTEHDVDAYFARFGHLRSRGRDRTVSIIMLDRLGLPVAVSFRDSAWSAERPPSPFDQ